MCLPLTTLRAGDTVITTAADQLASLWPAIIIEVRPAGQAELDNGRFLPLAALCQVETGERWCAISGYEGRYLLSSHGKTISLLYHGTARQRLLKVVGPHRYPSVSLSNGFGPQQLGLNRLVAQHFLPPPTEQRFRFVIPKDGNHLNIRADNLQWVDPQEQEDTLVLHYLHCCGERHPLHKLSRAEVGQLRDLLAQGISHQALAQRFGVSRPVVSHIARGLSRRSA
jgi:hypothetical protein